MDFSLSLLLIYFSCLAQYAKGYETERSNEVQINIQHISKNKFLTTCLETNNRAEIIFGSLQAHVAGLRQRTYSIHLSVYKGDSRRSPFLIHET